MEITFPVKRPEELTKLLEAALMSQPKGSVKMCVFSHISSMPTMIEPVESLTALSRQHGALSLVDGAHAPGVLEIDVQKIDCDFYLGNCHKWLFAPKGSAFMWVRRSLQTMTFPEPTVISSSGERDFVGRFAYTGTRDYSALCAIPAGLAFWRFLGGYKKIYPYCHNLVVQGAKLLAEKWNTILLVQCCRIPDLKKTPN